VGSTLRSLGFFLVGLVSFMFSASIYASEPSHEHEVVSGYLGMFFDEVQFIPKVPRAKEKVDVSLQIVNSYKINGKINEVPIDDQAIVLIIAEKEGKSIQEIASMKDNGTYLAELTFPEAGTWDILMKGIRRSHGAVSKAEFVKIIQVVEGERQENGYRFSLYMGISLVIAVAVMVVFWNTRRRAKANR
jgi:hypothetical protein